MSRQIQTEIQTDLVLEVGHLKMALRSFFEGRGKGRNHPPPPLHPERYVNYAIIAIYYARPIGKDYCRQIALFIDQLFPGADKSCS